MLTEGHQNCRRLKLLVVHQELSTMIPEPMWGSRDAVSARIVKPWEYFFTLCEPSRTRNTIQCFPYHYKRGARLPPEITPPSPEKVCHLKMYIYYYLFIFLRTAVPHWHYYVANMSVWRSQQRGREHQSNNSPQRRHSWHKAANIRAKNKTKRLSNTRMLLTQAMQLSHQWFITTKCFKKVHPVGNHMWELTVKYPRSHQHWQAAVRQGTGGRRKENSMRVSRQIIMMRRHTKL